MNRILSWTFAAEALAVALNLLYTWLYLKSDPYCYYFGIAGPLVLIIVCYSRRLYAEIALQLLYTAMAGYGLAGFGGEWVQKNWPPVAHLLLCFTIALGTIISGTLLRRRTDASFPYLDSLITWGGFAGTWAMVNYVHENWLYFIAINTLSVFVYFSRSLYLGALMYAIYLLMALDGYFRLHWFYS